MQNRNNKCTIRPAIAGRNDKDVGGGRRLGVGWGGGCNVGRGGLKVAQHVRRLFENNPKPV
eukprot:445745-Lingulodinium_polyedra.AAC.1